MMHAFRELVIGGVLVALGQLYISSDSQAYSAIRRSQS